MINEIDCYFPSLEVFHDRSWLFPFYFHFYIYIVFCFDSVFIFVDEIRFKMSKYMTQKLDTKPTLRRRYFHERSRNFENGRNLFDQRNSFWLHLLPRMHACIERKGIDYYVHFQDNFPKAVTLRSKSFCCFSSRP